MKIFELLSEPGFHTTIITTFCVDFEAYESIALQRLKRSGCHNNILLVDHRMLTNALEGGFTLPKHSGSLYSVLGVSSKGIFHPKIILQLGRQTARLIVSSANMTTAGMAGNLEIGGIIEFKNLNEEAPLRIISNAWAYVGKFINSASHASEQMKWAKERSLWLINNELLQKPIEFSDGTNIEFLVSSGFKSIGARFEELINDKPVNRLIAMSPYWDKELSALNSLVENLGVSECIILIDKDKCLFPSDALQKREFPKLKIFNLEGFELSKSRFAHAKLIIAQTDNFDHVLFGSANCSVAALGGKYRSENEEANFYCRYPVEAALQLLELDKFISESSEITIEELPKFNDQDTTSHDEEQNLKHPGYFEYKSGELYWWPSENLKTEGTELELLSLSGEKLESTAIQISKDNKGVVIFRISDINEVPAFVRILTSETTNYAMAIITNVNAVKKAYYFDRRDRTSSTSEEKLSAQTEVSLYFLELLNDLEATEEGIKLKAHSIDRMSSPMPNNLPNHTNEVTYQKLTFQQFMIRDRNQLNHRSNAKLGIRGSETGIIRNALNRLLSFKETDHMRDEEFNYYTSEGPKVDGRDEGDDDYEEDTYQKRIDFKTDNQSISQEEKDSIRDRAERRDTAEKIAGAVNNFNSFIREKRKSESLSMIDVLRLRTILMVIIASGGSNIDFLNKESDPRFQILPLEGMNSWPLLIGKLLYTFFNPKDPAFHSLDIENDHEVIPFDVLECLVTCIWSASVCQLIIGNHIKKSIQKLKEKFIKRMDQVYLTSKLSAQTLTDEPVLIMMKALNSRFSSKLGFDGEALMTEHLNRCIIVADKPKQVSKS